MSLIQRIAISLMFSLVMSSPVVSAGLSGPHEGPLDLSSAQWIEVEVHMVTPQAPMISTKVETIVKKRMEEVGYRIRKGQDTSPDVVIQVTCEEGESQISPSGVDPYLNHSVMNPERVIGPPCLFHYRYKDLPIPWHVVDRVIYTQGLQTVKHLITQNPDANQMSLLLGYLRASEFPLFFCAEWGQVDRLIDVFHSSDTPLSRKKMILLLLGEIQAQPSLLRRWLNLCKRKIWLGMLLVHSGNLEKKPVPTSPRYSAHLRSQRCKWPPPMALAGWWLSLAIPVQRHCFCRSSAGKGFILK